MKPPWYGANPLWWVPLERDARRAYRERLTIGIGARHLVYSIADLVTVGDDVPCSVRIEFHADPPYDTYRLPAEEFPRVYAQRLRSFDDEPPGMPTVRRKPGAWLSPHRHPGGALCLWYPRDPPERRWLPHNGLLVLIDMVEAHLFAERYHWLHDRWPLEEAPHGLGKVA